MNPFSHGLNLFRIARTLSRYRLDTVARATHLGNWVWPLKLLTPFGKVPENWSEGRRIRLALQELGPIFVKFGQVLSTRRDVLSPAMADELSLLQDQVEPFSGDRAMEIIESSLGQPIAELYNEFSSTPLASASIAQVHAAKMNDGRDVVIKVLRPDVAPVIQRDINLMLLLASLAQKYWSESSRVKPLELVQEFEKTIFDELDLIREASNASLLRKNWLNSEHLYIPEIHWSHTSHKVLTMERVYGFAVDDKKALLEAGINLKVLARRGLEIFYQQVFRDNLFHADMHPGNILVSPENPENPMFIALDFGIVGSLSDSDLRYIAENFRALFDRDYRRVAQLHIDSGWVPSNTRVEELEAAARAVCEPHFSRPLKEISFGALLYNLFAVAKRFNLNIQPQLILLQKTLLNVEGIGRDLDPDLNPWDTAAPLLKQIMRDRYGPRGTMRRLKDQLPLWLEHGPDMPELLRDYLRMTTRGQITMTMKSEVLEELRQENEQGHRANFSAIITAALIISTALLFVLDPEHSHHLFNVPVEAAILAVISLVSLLRTLAISANRKRSKNRL